MVSVVMPVAHLTYIVLVETLNHAQSINESVVLSVLSVCW